MTHIFITGGTGFIGTQTLEQLSREDHTVSVLVRSKARWEQIRKQLGWLSGDGQRGTSVGKERFSPVIGDLSLPGLGLSAPDIASVLTADVIIHAGGPMDIRIGESEARAVFLQAAEELLNLASQIQTSKGLQHFIHIVGFKSPFTDDNFHNPAPIIASLEQESPYERMKFLADLRIRQGAMQLSFPLSVVHPSVLIGNSEHGDTPQTGGLGILVQATARRLMSITPGGNSHWLPLFHINHAAEFISTLTKESNPVSQTYYLLNEKKQSPSIMELVSGIAKELRVSKPLGAISPKLLSKVLGSPLGQKIGIPKESLDFIVDVNQAYPLTAAQDMQRKYGLEHVVNASIMPYTISDLDFRLVHSHPQADGYIRGKRGPLATLERVGSDKGKPPILFVHGTLSGADCLLPLAEQFPEFSVCLVDLPGFGRSPYHHGADVIEGHVESLVQAIRSFETPVTLVGHSLGGLLAAHAYARVPEQIHRLHLLQPALHSAARRYHSARINEAALRMLRAASLRKQLLAQSCFTDISDIPPAYVTYVLAELQSPRVRKTTAETLSALTRAESFAQLQPGAWLLGEASILWGTQDRVCHLPERFRSARTVEIAAAHHFPISHPALTAQLLRQQGL